MKILLAHNYYQQPGGEDLVYEAEADLLERRGHEVVRFSVHNDALRSMSKARLAAATWFNKSCYMQLREIMRAERPDVVHFHNTFPLISAAGYAAARSCRVPVVQTLHNYRLACANALFYRNERVCEDCLGRLVPWPAVAHRCYRDSAGASAVVALMLLRNRLLGVYRKQVDAYIALTEFARAKLLATGLPPEKTHVKPNFLDPDPGVGSGDGGYALFVGRLDAYKGVGTVLSAWKSVQGAVRLRVVGAGAMADEVREAAAGNGVEYLGQLSHQDVCEQLKRARFLVYASEIYEGLPRVLMEAMAVGTPVAAARLGAAEATIREGETGLFFEAGDADGLAQIVRRSEQFAAMRPACRQEFLDKYTADTHYRRILEIYEGVIRGGPLGDSVGRSRE